MYLVVNKLNFYKNYTDISKIIENFLLDICLNNIGLSNQLFWILTMYFNLIHPYTLKIFDKTCKTMIKSYRVFQMVMILH